MSPSVTDSYEQAASKLPFMSAQLREEFDPLKVVELAPNVRRITAPNPGMMTGPGTNTFIIGQHQLTVIDPGPAIEEHVHHIAEICDGKLQQILVTHTHPDHSPGTALLKQLTGAPVRASPVTLSRVYDETFTGFLPLNDGDRVENNEYAITVFHTPGHVANHLCFLLNDPQWLFAGDMVMDGATVVIAPPDGNMSDYMSSLRRLGTAPIESIAPAHGRLIGKPTSYLSSLVKHRLAREQKVIDRLKKLGSATIDTLLPVVYDDVPSALHPAAAMSLEAHLLKLVEEEQIVKDDQTDNWSLTGTG
ncbi:MAG: MBL fold metallo-hydrolase [Gammaproteobacteria bacterium]